MWIFIAQMNAKADVCLRINELMMSRIPSIVAGLCKRKLAAGQQKKIVGVLCKRWPKPTSPVLESRRCHFVPNQFIPSMKLTVSRLKNYHWHCTGKQMIDYWDVWRFQTRIPNEEGIVDVDV
jgi:hypothetical protein